MRPTPRPRPKMDAAAAAAPSPSNVLAEERERELAMALKMVADSSSSAAGVNDNGDSDDDDDDGICTDDELDAPSDAEDAAAAAGRHPKLERRTRSMAATLRDADMVLDSGPAVFKTRGGFGVCEAVRALEATLASLPRGRVFPASGGAHASRDLEAYRAHYYGRTPNDTTLFANVRFYRGESRCRPDRMLIDDLHAEWATDYHRLEAAHGYIQWLFPIHEAGMNYESQVLQQHEADVMRADPAVQARLLTSYQLMLNFYGFALANPSVRCRPRSSLFSLTVACRVTGAVTRHVDASHWKKRFHNLCTHSHNFLRITRISKCLGELGLEHFQVRWSLGSSVRWPYSM